MKIKDVIFEDFVNYKNPCMTIMMPHCDFKCDKECGLKVCQNSDLVKYDTVDISIDELIEAYIDDCIGDKGMKSQILRHGICHDFDRVVRS